MSSPSSLPTIALVGDYSPQVPAHVAIPRAFELIRAAGGGEVSWRWVATTEIQDAARDLAPFSAVWLVPASPYKNMAGALAAVRWARETRRPFLGTCGGFQHALIEFARDVAGIREADHAESNPHGTELVVTALGCSLVDSARTAAILPRKATVAASGPIRFIAPRSNARGCASPRLTTTAPFARPSWRKPRTRFLSAPYSSPNAPLCRAQSRRSWLRSYARSIFAHRFYF